MEGLITVLMIGAGLAQKQTCPHCRKVIPGSATRCSFCQGEVTPLASQVATGSTISAPTLAITDAPTAPVAPGASDCRICGAALLEGARFCARCGGAVGA